MKIIVYYPILKNVYLSERLTLYNRLNKPLNEWLSIHALKIDAMVLRYRLYK